MIAVHESPGLVRIDSFHRNYAPAVCRRTLALVDGRLLVVIDTVENIAPASTVQIYFHLDSLKVAWDQAANRALADDADVKLALYTGGGLQGELLPGRISESPDTERPSTRLKLSDEGGPARRTWLTVLAPWRAGAKRPEIKDIVVSSDQRRCSFTCDGIEHRLDCQA